MAKRILSVTFICFLAACGSSTAATSVTDDTTTNNGVSAEVDADIAPLTSEQARPVATTSVPQTEPPATTAPVVEDTETTTTAPPAAATAASLEVLPDGDIAETSVEPASILLPLLDELASSPVPVRLPSSLGPLDDEQDVYANVSWLDEDSYTVTIGLDPECNGGNVCRIGTLSGRRLGADDQRLVGGTAVPLPNGRTGMFFDATCGANCGDGFVAWMEGDVEYTVGAKLAPGPDMLAWAWDTLATGQNPEPPVRCWGGEAVGEFEVQVVEGGVADLHYFVSCRASDGEPFAEVLDGNATIRPVAGFESVAAVEKADGTIKFFGSSFAVLDPTYDQPWAHHRLTISNLRCGDSDDDGILELIDVDRALAFDVQLPYLPNAVTADQIDSFSPC